MVCILLFKNVKKSLYFFIDPLNARLQSPATIIKVNGKVLMCFYKINTYNISDTDHSSGRPFVDAFLCHLHQYMVDSHESYAFGPYFENVCFLNIQNKQRLYITLSEAPHLHLINSQHFFCFSKFEFF